MTYTCRNWIPYECCNARIEAEGAADEFESAECQLLSKTRENTGKFGSEIEGRIKKTGKGCRHTKRNRRRDRRRQIQFETHFADTLKQIHLHPGTKKFRHTSAKSDHPA